MNRVDVIEQAVARRTISSAVVEEVVAGASRTEAGKEFTVELDHLVQAILDVGHIAGKRVQTALDVLNVGADLRQFVAELLRQCLELIDLFRGHAGRADGTRCASIALRAGRALLAIFTSGDLFESAIEGDGELVTGEGALAAGSSLPGSRRRCLFAAGW